MIKPAPGAPIGRELRVSAERSAAAAAGNDVAVKDDWKGTIIAGLANYIDAGSIVAGSPCFCAAQRPVR